MDHPGPTFGRSPGSTETSPRDLFGSIPSASEIFPDDINEINEDTRLRHARSEQPDVATASHEGEPLKKRLHRAPPPWNAGSVPNIAVPGAGLNLDQPVNEFVHEPENSLQLNLSSRQHDERDERDAKEKRRLQNRKAAARHRERARQCREEVDELRREIAALKAEKAELLQKLQYNSTVCIDSTMEWVLQTFWLRRKLHFASVSKIVTNVTSLFELVRSRRDNPDAADASAERLQEKTVTEEAKNRVPKEWRLLWRSGSGNPEP